MFRGWAVVEESGLAGPCSSNLCSHPLCFAGTFRVELERGPVSGKTVVLDWMVLLLEVREFQVLREVVQKVSTEFIDGP